MRVTIGSLVLAAGSRAEPCRLAATDAARQVQRALRVRAADAAAYDRANVSVTDTLRAVYAYGTPALAAAGLEARVAEALSAPAGAVEYGGVPKGAGLVERAAGEVYGCSAEITWTVVRTVQRPAASGS